MRDFWFDDHRRWRELSRVNRFCIGIVATGIASLAAYYAGAGDLDGLAAIGFFLFLTFGLGLWGYGR